MFDPEKECNELQEDIASEEDPWAGTGMDDEEETLPKDQHVGKEAGGVWGKNKKDDNCQSEDPTGSSKTTVRYLCSRLTWNMAWNAWRVLGDFGECASQF